MKIFFLIAVFGLLAVCERPPAPNADHSLHDHSNIQPAHDHAKMESSPGAAESPHELQFIDTMIAHHHGAISMAQLVNTRTQRPEMKKLATAIIQEQRNEVARLQEWRKRWFGEAKPAINMDFPGMRTGMSGMDLAKLDSLKANEFDVEFLRQMIPHHEGAIEMAKSFKSNDSYTELKDLADSIIETQSTEIAQMKAWLSEWSAGK